MSKKTRRTKPKTNNVTKQKSTRKIMSGGKTLVQTPNDDNQGIGVKINDVNPKPVDEPTKPDANADATTTTTETTATTTETPGANATTTTTETPGAKATETTEPPGANANATAATADKCFEHPSLLSTVPPECIVPGPQPQFHDLMKAAIRAPVDKAIEKCD